MRYLPFVLLLLPACSATEPSVAEITQAVGEPQNSFPTADERLGLMAINRGRSDPSTVKGPNSAFYPARPPVAWTYELSRSSRFHAINLQLTTTTLMHTSPCTLNTNVATANCNGAPACACAKAVPVMCQNCANVPDINTCGTDPFIRIGYFTAGTNTQANGEVAAAGYPDPWQSVLGWMTEAAGADGHRQNLCDQGITSNTMGFGHTGASGCWQSFDISDSGSNNALVVPKLPVASVYPVRGNAGASYGFYASWADPVSGAPQSIQVVVDGACTAMARELGTATLNETFLANKTLAAGCHTYYILATDAKGVRITYPTVGALQISVGGVACNGDYTPNQPSAICSMPAADMGPADLIMPADLTMPPDLTMVIVPPDLATRPADLTLPPPDLATQQSDLATQQSDLATQQPDLATQQPDLTMQPPDLVMPVRDLSMLPLPDLTPPRDLTAPLGSDLTMKPPADLAGMPPADLANASARDLAMANGADAGLAGDDGGAGGMTPAGCSCEVPGRRGSQGPGLAWVFAVLVPMLALAARRRRRALI